MKTHSFLTLMLFSLVAIFCAQANETDEQALLNEVENALPEIIDNPLQAPGAACGLNAVGIIDLISGALTKGDILRLLQENLYLRTNRLNVRSLLDLPSLQPYYLDYCGWQGTAQLFYNQTERAFFNSCSPFLKSYISLEDSPLANEIQTILEDINDFAMLELPIAINIPQALSLFKNMRVQERRAGIFLSGAYVESRWNLTAQIPLYYLEHNFFLNEREQNEIKNAPFFKFDQIGDNRGSREDVQLFFRKVLVNDRVGLGDMRVYGLCNILENDWNDSWLGILFTFPTAVDISRGIYGSRCDKAPVQPFDLQTIINAQEQFCNTPEKATQMIEDFSIGALRRLAKLLIDIPLGNGGFVGFGPHFEMKNYFNSYLSTHTTIEFEFFASKMKKRYFVTDKNALNFNRDLSDESQAAANLAFINQQVINTFYPHGLCVEVHPGSLAKLRHEFVLDSCRNQFTLGFDFWYQSKEHFSIPLSHGLLICPTSYAQRPSAYQGKIYGLYGHYAEAKFHNVDWYAMVNFDATIFNKGIGKDFTLGVRLGFDF